MVGRTAISDLCTRSPIRRSAGTAWGGPDGGTTAIGPRVVSDSPDDQTKAAAPPWWRDPAIWRRMIMTYAVAISAGFAAARLGLPLPWMLGPFFACGTLSALGVRLRVLPMGRELAQVTIGLSIGLRFTAATLVATLSLAPAMVAATVYVMAYTMVAAFLFRPLAGVNRPTAFFATAAGGVADMAVIAQERGGDAPAVAIVHALRVSMTVAIVPILVVTFGAPGLAPDRLSASGDSAVWLALALGVAFLFARLLGQTPLPNPWLVGPMFLGLFLGTTGLLSAAFPPAAILLAQALLGTWLGSQFRQELLLALPRVALFGIAATLFMICAAFGGAVVLAATTSLSVATSFLALAPAAVTEMVITAKTMHLDPEIITGFHIMRIFIVCATALLVYRLYDRIGAIFGRD